MSTAQFRYSVTFPLVKVEFVGEQRPVSSSQPDPLAASACGLNLAYANLLQIVSNPMVSGGAAPIWI